MQQRKSIFCAQESPTTGSPCSELGVSGITSVPWPRAICLTCIFPPHTAQGCPANTSPLWAALPLVLGTGEKGACGGERGSKDTAGGPQEWGGRNLTMNFTLRPEKTSGWQRLQVLLEVTSLAPWGMVVEWTSHQKREETVGTFLV